MMGLAHIFLEFWLQIFFSALQQLRYTWFFTVQFLFEMFNSLAKHRQSIPHALDEIFLQSAISLAHRIRSRQLSSEQVVSAYIRRIKQVNPLLNAMIDERFEEALKEARRVDEEIATGSTPGPKEAPFFGVPFTLKDHVGAKGLLLTCGLFARKGIRATEDSEVVKHLKAAGGICLALTNVSEDCMHWESVNTLYGRTNNPYDPRRTCGGSSGGEGALIGAAASVFGIGSDIGGSIRIPCFYNVIISHEGTYPSVNGLQGVLQTCGPMCRYAEDLSPMLKVLAGPNADRLNLDLDVDISKLRVFYLYEIKTLTIAPLCGDMKNALDKVVMHLRKMHNLLPLQIDLPLFAYATTFWANDFHVEGAPTIAQEMCDLKGDFNPATEFFKALRGTSSHTIAGTVVALLELLGNYFHSPEAAEKMRQLRKQLQDELVQLLGDDGILLFPTHPTLAPFHNAPLLMLDNWAYTGIFNSLGLPVTQVPLGLNRDGMPTGVQVIAAAHMDRLGLALARDLEKAFGGWVSPR